MSVILPRVSPLPIVAFLMAIAGWTLLPLIGSIVAILCARAARAEMHNSPALLDDGGLTRAALVLGWGALIAAAIALLIVLAVLRYSASLV